MQRVSGRKRGMCGGGPARVGERARKQVGRRVPGSAEARGSARLEASAARRQTRGTHAAAMPRSPHPRLPSRDARRAPSPPGRSRVARASARVAGARARDSAEILARRRRVRPFARRCDAASVSRSTSRGSWCARVAGAGGPLLGRPAQRRVAGPDLAEARDADRAGRRRAVSDRQSRAGCRRESHASRSIWHAARSRSRGGEQGRERIGAGGGRAAGRADARAVSPPPAAGRTRGPRGAERRGIAFERQRRARLWDGRLQVFPPLRFGRGHPLGLGFPPSALVRFAPRIASSRSPPPPSRPS